MKQTGKTYFHSWKR